MTETQDLEQIAFKMKLFPGFEAEYRKRHDEIWPELVALLKEAGISDYSIFLDPETLILFAVLRRPAVHGMDRLPETEVMRRWWAMMGDIMASNPDGSPVTAPLVPMFHLP
ncbi:L-rhamnose mutarotase [Segnochrobactrum spirostomi]|uniref:L-rhamnose mutarotase n=1 Tax=Segnochrobactrum spirostomi TaxID=2608987 RepID=A0A6A7Y2U6_9HYPH|nr:L-rhamnose mutarotase [Segnochrobactrum spirostomi]MQT12598.1 L-rhamnose mutarotase [Segnochrobactrum spirostomi]